MLENKKEKIESYSTRALSPISNPISPLIRGGSKIFQKMWRSEEDHEREGVSRFDNNLFSDDAVFVSDVDDTIEGPSILRARVAQPNSAR